MLLATSVSGEAQVFLGSRPHPEFTVGPLFVRASVTPEVGPLRVDLLWSLVIPPERSAAGLEQDLYVIWPGAVLPEPGLGQRDPALARYVEARGFTVIEEGRLQLFAQNLYQMDQGTASEPVPGGAPFVTFVRTGGALGLSSPATYVRIPWTPRLVNRVWLIDLRMRTTGLVKPKPGTWIEHMLWGDRYRLSLSFNEVGGRAVFPLYVENRNRALRLADEPAQIVVEFAQADHLKIDDLFPQSSRRQLSETLENTDTVSLFLDRTERVTPQTLTVQFGYFFGLQAWAPILIPIAFFALGNFARPAVEALIKRAGRAVAARVVAVGRGSDGEVVRDRGVVIPRETLARIVPGETTQEEVLKLCGRSPEIQEELGSPDKRTLVYRGRRVVPHRQRTYGWFATVSHWDAEHHEVEISIERNVVRDVQARVRRTRLTHPEAA